MYGYEWTEENGIFRLTINAKIQKEIRPVFHEELDFFGMDQYWDYPKDTTAPLLWAEGVRRYVLNGVCVAEAQGGGFYTKPTIKRLTEERLKLVPIDTDRLYEVNRQIMLSLEQKAVQFIQTQYEHYLPLGFSFVCAFSGGKDSLVLLDLMTKALAPKDYYVVFSNTGMELSDTLKTFVDAQKHWPGVRFKEAKCHMDMEESWNEFGPPASKLRWCCSVRKSVPTLMLLSELTGKDTKAVVFDGVRAEESLRRFCLLGCSPNPCEHHGTVMAVHSYRVLKERFAETRSLHRHDAEQQVWAVPNKLLQGKGLCIYKDIACYNGVGSEKLTASELYRCPNLSYNEDVLRERSIA